MARQAARQAVPRSLPAAARSDRRFPSSWRQVTKTGCLSAHGFDEMKHFAAYYAGVYSYDNTTKFFHPWFPSYNPQFIKMYDDIVNLDEWEGVEGGWRVPGVMWWPGHIPAGVTYYEMMSHIDCWATLAGMVGITPPPHDWGGNDGK